MAGPTINTKVKLDGEREYKEALAEMNSGLKVLASELKLASAQFDDNAKSAEALTAKNDILERSILSQEEKIAKLREALQNSVEQYGEASTKTGNWKVQLNNAEAELIKMQRELDANSDALKRMSSPLDKIKTALAETKQQGGGVKELLGNLKEQFSLSSEKAAGLGTALQDIAGKFGVELPDGAAKFISSLNGINAKAALAATGIGLVAAACIKAEKALIDMTKESAAYADNILTMSQTTGQTTDQLQEFAYATELIDVSLDTLQGSLTKLTNNMQDAINGTGNAQAAFMQLGITLTEADGSWRSANDVFYDAIDALGQVENATERDALAMDIFGRSAQDLNPLIIQGSDTLRAYAQEAHDMGYVLENDALDALGAVDDGLQRLQKTQEGVSNQISAEFAPYMAEALGDTADFVLKIGNAFKESGIVDDFGSMLTSASDLLEPLGELIKIVLPGLETALHPIAVLMATIADTANLIVGLLTLNGDKIKTALGWNVSSGQLSNQQKLYYKNALASSTYTEGTGWTGGGGYIETGTGKWIPYNASGSDYFYGGPTWIGENGPELVWLPRGTQIMNNQESRNYGGDVYNITIDARSVKEFNDLIDIAQNARRMGRMRGDNNEFDTNG